jgi:hypothetical protein
MQVLEYLVNDDALSLITSVSQWGSQKHQGIIPKLWRTLIECLNRKDKVVLNTCIETFAEGDANKCPYATACPTVEVSDDVRYVAGQA